MSNFLTSMAGFLNVFRVPFWSEILGLFPWIIATTTTTVGLTWHWLFMYTYLELCCKESKNVYYCICKIIMLCYFMYTEQILNVRGHAFQFWLSCKWAVQTKPVHSAAKVSTCLWVYDTPAVVNELVCQWNACVSTNGYYFWELVSHHRQHSHLYCIKWSVFITVLLLHCRFLHKLNNTWHKGRKQYKIDIYLWGSHKSSIALTCHLYSGCSVLIKK